MAGLIGRMLGRYEILAFVGRGGMGEVYRARDTELGRDVAVKVLPPETAADSSRLERFKLEARAVAQLSHPNILDIHDFGTEDGVTYSVTELLEGSDLRDRLAGHPLPLSKVLSISRSIAEGLAAAHGKGIVHRDVKPANIFLTPTGQVKILDFGIASLRGELIADIVDSGSPTKTLTKAGRIVGTTAYMSPEQVAGGQVDARSDIFSLGSVMYEMVTGLRAFDGATPNETMAAIVSKDPTPIGELRSDVPPGLELLIKRCLEKQSGERFESARDVAFALEALSDERTPSRPLPVAGIARRSRSLRAAAAGAVVVVAVIAVWKLVESRLPLTPELPAQKHLAVLDFEADGVDPELVALADGLTEALSSRLRILERQTRGGVWVVPRRHRTVAGRWTVESVSRLHGVTLAVAGELTSSGDRLRLELRLVEPGTARSLRSAVIEDQIDNVATFQTALVVEVAAMLGITPSADTLDELERSSTRVVPALVSYLSGLGRLVRAVDSESLEVALRDLELSVAEDPTFVAASAALLRTCAALIRAGGDIATRTACGSTAEVISRQASADLLEAEADLKRALGDGESAVELMKRAVTSRPDDAELQLRLGQDLQATGDLDGAEEAYQRAVDLRPDYWEGFYYVGYLDWVRGRYEATANAWRIAARCAPERSSLFSNLGAVFHYLDRPDEAMEMFRRAIEVSDTGNYVALSNLGTLYFESGRYAEAVSVFLQALGLNDSDYRIWGYLGWSYAAGVDPGRADEPFQRAAGLAEEALTRDADNPDLLAKLAGYYAMLGQRDRGLELIERAIALAPTDPGVMASIGESLEDLGDRDRALEWIAGAVRQGRRRVQIENHPSLRELVADERYQQMVGDPHGQAARQEP
ncbi:MAG: protein kinase [Thermoanaerobaculales bacterium]|nr:protein kinase [Thermoanaerobaculales bacterium]